MPLIRSLTSGASSLRTHQRKMEIISNNIANVSTVGFKGASVTFSDQFSQSINFGSQPNRTGLIGGRNPFQIGLGVQVGSIRQDFSQGSINSTTSTTDVALQGDGFFSLRYNGQDVVSRAGSFAFDSNGNFIDTATGAFVQGYNMRTDANGKVIRDDIGENVLDRVSTNLKLSPSFKSGPRQTQNVSFVGNLDIRAATGDVRTASIQVIDNQGTSRLLDLTFTKTANPGEYDLTGSISGFDIASLPGFGPIQFNADGTLGTPLNFTVPAADLNTALGAGSTAFDAVTPKDVTITLSSLTDAQSGLTQFAGATTVTGREQDGYPNGNLARVQIDPTGKILGSFDNGQTEILGQLVITKFPNPSGLVKNGNNFFAASPNSGAPTLGTALEIFPSTAVIGSALEESNVDLTEQFTEMISTQRAFEAAARTITVSDQFLQEINQLKR